MTSGRGVLSVSSDASEARDATEVRAGSERRRSDLRLEAAERRRGVRVNSWRGVGVSAGGVSPETRYWWSSARDARSSRSRMSLSELRECW